MEQVGVKELKAHASEILRRVREEGESIEITYRGEVVAELSPVSQTRRSTKEYVEEHLATMRELAEDIGKHSPPNVSVEDIMNDIRREL